MLWSLGPLAQYCAELKFLVSLTLSSRLHRNTSVSELQVASRLHAETVDACMRGMRGHRQVLDRDGCARSFTCF